MNRFMLILLMCSLAGLSQATFELEDPSDPEKQTIEKKENSLFKNWRSSDEVIVAPGTYLYMPDFGKNQCEGWQADESEPSPGNTNVTQSFTATTYLGTLLSKIDCYGEDGSKQFSLVQINDGRMIWVESGKVLSAD